MAVEIFLTLDGIEGTSMSPSHWHWIEISSCAWALGRVRAQKGDTTGQHTVGNELTLSKRVGPESAELMTRCAGGVLTPTAQLSIVPQLSKREAPQKYVLFSLEKVLVKSIHMSSDRDEDAMHEKLTLRFGQIRFEHFAPVIPGGAEGTPKPEETSFQFDFSGAA